MNARAHHVIAPEDRVPVGQKIAYGLGALVTTVSVNSVMQLASLVYVVGLGISAIWIAYAQALPRLWDAIVDPFLGNVSDNTRSRFGRRVPFLVAGGVLIGIAFSLLWMVPRDWGKPAMFAYFTVASLLFYTVVPVFAIPHGALGLEMTADHHEKTSVFAWASFVANVGALMLPWVYFLANRPIFGGDEVNGVKWICFGMSAVLTAAALVCAFVCREGRLEQVKSQQRVPLFESFASTYRNRTFVRLVAVFVLVIAGFQLVMGFGNYIQIFYLFGGDKDAASSLMAQNGTLWAIVAIAGVSPMTWLSKQLGKRTTVIGALALIAGGNLTKIVCYDPAIPKLTYLPTVCLSLGMLFCFSLVNSMISDVCDEDELATGIRREGTYFAVYNWWWKVAVVVAGVASGYLQRFTGFVEGAGVQSPATMFWLRFWEIGLPPLLCAVAIALLANYPLTEARAYEIKALLAARRPRTEGTGA
jgi:glycoside/pentoside/hexuronide:cation symporter, GPH family